MADDTSLDDAAITPKLLAYRAAPGRFGILAGHVVVDVGSCNCAAAEYMGVTAHEFGCGAEPLMTVDEFRALSEEDLGRLLRTAGLASSSQDETQRAVLAELTAGMRQITELLGMDVEAGEVGPVVERVRALVSSTPNNAHPTLAETRTGHDWCPNCRQEAGTNRYRDEGGTERCAMCGSELETSSGNGGYFTDLTARLAAADIGWAHQHGDPLAVANPDYIRFLAQQVEAFEPRLDGESVVERMAKAISAADLQTGASKPSYWTQERLDEEWDACGAQWQEKHRIQARAALAALREATA